MHITEGWMIFVVAFVLLGGVAWLLGTIEERWAMRGLPPAPVDAEADAYEDDAYAADDAADDGTETDPMSPTPESHHG